MLVAVALLLAAQAVGAPQSAQLRGLVSPGDYPADALRNGEQGTVIFALKIGIDGLPKQCLIVQSSKSESLDRATCAVMMKRARFKPARDSHGVAVEDVYQGQLNWRLSG